MRHSRAQRRRWDLLPIGPDLAESLRERWHAYRKQLKNAQTEFSVENVHELRVQTRRLMSKLVLIHYVLPDPRVDKARRILKRRLGVLGCLRDTHVQLSFLNRNLDRYPGILGLLVCLRQRECRLRKPAFKKAKRFKTAKLGRWIAKVRAELKSTGLTQASQEVLRKAVWRATERAFNSTLKRFRAINPADVSTIHRTRVAFKRFRYMVECLPRRVWRPSELRRAELASYQRKMGSIQDTQVMLEKTESFAREHADKAVGLRKFQTYLLGRRHRLVQRYLSGAEDLLKFWPPKR